jgi:hypothetical protein
MKAVHEALDVEKVKKISMSQCNGVQCSQHLETQWCNPKINLLLEKMARRHKRIG